MAIAKKLIDKNPNNCDAYNALAFALSRRARETSDITFYAQRRGSVAEIACDCASEFWCRTD